MDLDDVSTVPEYVETLRHQKAEAQKAQAVKGRKAIPDAPREDIIDQFMFDTAIVRQSPLYKPSIRALTIAPVYPPSVVSLNKLKKIFSQDFLLETHHRGRYALVRTVTPINIMTVAMVIVEDEEGDVFNLNIYNRAKELSDAQGLPEGTVLAIKEPYVKVSSNESYAIRVDHLSDMIFLPGFDERVSLDWRPRIRPTKAKLPSFWITRGRRFFQDDHFQLAIQCHTQALQCAPTDDQAIAIHIDRALFYLKTHQFDAALLDTDAVLQKSAMSEKALFRKAQALYFLRRYPECCDTYELLVEKYPVHILAYNLQRASAYLSEEQTGNYQFKEMILEAKKRRPPLLEHGTYIGPVTIKTTQKRGRGLFTTKEVKAGDLLLCEKAFAHVFHDEEKPGTLTLSMGLDTNRITLGTHGELTEVIAQKLHRNPSLVSKFTDLFHGSYESSNIQTDGQPVIDTFLVEKIVNLNCFGCPLLSRDHLIKMSNADVIPSGRYKNRKVHSSGVWLMASYINHSCLSNACRSFIGDMMIVRASKDIPTDTEITFSYQTPTGNTEKPSKLKHWNFECNCAMCAEIQGLTRAKLSKRKKFSGRLREQLNSNGLVLTNIERALAPLKETFSKPATEVPHIELWHGCLTVADGYLNQGCPEKAIEFCLEGLQAIGFEFEVNGKITKLKIWGLVTYDVIRCWMIVARACRELASGYEDYAMTYAKVAYRICVGEDETFEGTYSKSSERADGFLVTFE